MMGRAIDRYLLKQIIGPLVMTLAIAALLLILERMLRLFDFVVNEGGPAGVVFQMLANLTPHYMGLALPVGLFLGVLLAFRRLSLTSELDAILASGVSLARLMRPILALSLFLMVINIALSGWVQPVSRYTYRQLVFDLRSGALGASIQVGDFTTLGDGFVLRISESRENGKDLRGIFLERQTDGGSITVSAERGGFYATDDSQTIILRLQGGMLVDLNESQNKPRILTFDEQDLTIRLPASEAFRNRGGEERELTLPELAFQRLDTTLPSETRSAYNAQFHWRIANSFSFLVLPMLAVAMGITNKRTGTGSGLVVGISLLIVYNELMEAMEGAVTRGTSPYISIWALYAGFGLISFAFFYVVAFRVGGDPLKLINMLWAAISKPLKSAGTRIFGIEVK